jgi:menaquinone-specific isochorismate synthase
MTHALTDRSPLVARSASVADTLDGELLDHLGADGFAWLDGDRPFVTAGIAAVVTPEEAPAVLRAIAYDSGDAPADARPRAVGALPFAGGGRLVVPSLIVGRGWCTTIEPADSTATLRIAHSRPTRFVVEACTGSDAWRNAVNDVLASIARGDVEKVVLARAVRVQADEPFDVRRVLAELRRTQPGCTVYADGGFVGATPELLVAKHGNDVLSRPLAGTATSAEALTRSEKDAREHEIVVDAVTGALAPFTGDVRAEGPSPITLADLTHLATTVTAECGATTSVVDLVRALHPTPAVAGTPRAAALEQITALEPVARGAYAGPCGWVDAHGDGAFVVALRCAAIDGAVAIAHAGAGIVAGSDPDAEWNETQQKLEPMLRALVRP